MFRVNSHLKQRSEPVDLSSSRFTVMDSDKAHKRDVDKNGSFRGVAKSAYQNVLADIYQDSIAMVIWQRSLGLISAYADLLLVSDPNFAFKSQGTPDQLNASLTNLLPDAEYKALFIEDVILLSEMFACLFDLEEVGLRLNVLSNAMCPRFHVDKIPCRLVSTYVGSGSEWLHEAHVVRHQLGLGGHVSDYNSGLLESGCINRLDVGDVALMKGDEWPTALGRGVVHRSPAASLENKRLFLSLDMV